MPWWGKWNNRVVAPWLWGTSAPTLGACSLWTQLLCWALHSYCLSLTSRYWCSFKTSVAFSAVDKKLFPCVPNKACLLHYDPAYVHIQTEINTYAHIHTHSTEQNESWNNLVCTLICLIYFDIFLCALFILFYLIL